MPLATESLDGTGIAKLAGGQAPLIGLPRDGVDDAVALPSPTVVGVFLEGFRNVAFIRPVRVHAHDALALLFRILNLPVHPVTVFCLGRNVHEESAGPSDLRGENTGLDIVGARRLVR